MGLTVIVSRKLMKIAFASHVGKPCMECVQPDIKGQSDSGCRGQQLNKAGGGRWVRYPNPNEIHHNVLKHSLASHLVAGNVNLALVKQALGHRSINSTMQYVHN